MAALTLPAPVHAGTDQTGAWNMKAFLVAQAGQRIRARIDMLSYGALYMWACNISGERVNLS